MTQGSRNVVRVCDADDRSVCERNEQRRKNKSITFFIWNKIKFESII